jgi:hypothetical protein
MSKIYALLVFYLCELQRLPVSGVMWSVAGIDDGKFRRVHGLGQSMPIVVVKNRCLNVQRSTFISHVRYLMINDFTRVVLYKCIVFASLIYLILSVYGLAV